MTKEAKRASVSVVWESTPTREGKSSGSSVDVVLGGDDEDVAAGPALDAAHLFVVRVAEDDDGEAFLAESASPTAASA